MVSDNGKKAKSKRKKANKNPFLGVSGTAMSGEYTGMMPTPAVDEDARESYNEMIER